MRLLATVATLAILASPVDAISNDIDATMNAFLRTWENNATVTRAKVDELYSRRVNYYGQVMSRDQVLRAKQSIVQRYPNRKYSVVPGTVTQHCGGGTCTIDLVMDWAVFWPTGGAATSGSTTVSLSLSPEDGTYKITAESGVPVAHSR